MAVCFFTAKGESLQLWSTKAKSYLTNHNHKWDTPSSLPYSSYRFHSALKRRGLYKGISGSPGDYIKVCFPGNHSLKENPKVVLASKHGWLIQFSKAYLKYIFLLEIYCINLVQLYHFPTMDLSISYVLSLDFIKLYWFLDASKYVYEVFDL